MVQHHKHDLLQKLVEAIQESGWNVAYLGSIDVHPFHLQIYREDQVDRVRVYIWHMTHGGGKARPQHEYRIQITGTRAFQQAPGEKTLILGWWKEADVFAGFDVRRHPSPFGRSPSMQIREDCLRQAYLNGFSPCSNRRTRFRVTERHCGFVSATQRG